MKAIDPLFDYNITGLGYRHGSETSYSNFHLGYDNICRTGTRLIAKTNLNVIKVIPDPENRLQGGNQIWCTVDGLPYIFRYMHLLSFAGLGKYKAGQVVALSGNSGRQTTAPHVHVDVSRPVNGQVVPTNTSLFIDPKLIKLPTIMAEKKSIQCAVLNFYNSKTQGIWWVIPTDPSRAVIELYSNAEVFRKKVKALGNPPVKEMPLPDYENVVQNGKAMYYVSDTISKANKQWDGNGTQTWNLRILKNWADISN